MVRKSAPKSIILDSASFEGSSQEVLSHLRQRMCAAWYVCRASSGCHSNGVRVTTRPGLMLGMEGFPKLMTDGEKAEPGRMFLSLQIPA